MEFSHPIKVIVFITSCLILIAEKSQGGIIKDNYIIVRPGELRRLNQILRSAGDSPVDSKPWNKREDYDELTTTTRPSVGSYTDKNEIFIEPLKNLSNINGNYPPKQTDSELVRRDVRRKLENSLLSSIDYVPVYYLN